MDDPFPNCLVSLLMRCRLFENSIIGVFLCVGSVVINGIFAMFVDSLRKPREDVPLITDTDQCPNNCFVDVCKIMFPGGEVYESGPCSCEGINSKISPQHFVPSLWLFRLLQPQQTHTNFQCLIIFVWLALWGLQYVV